MKRHIAEELPERQHRQVATGQAPKDGGNEKKGGKTPEERIRQAVYDIRYRARREEIPLTQAFSQYMQNSNMSQVEKTAVRKKLAGKDGAMKEEYQIEDLASTTVAKALFKVFVEGVDKDEIGSKPNQEKETIISAEELYFEQIQRTKDRKYKVRVTGTDGRSYVRYATREKINQLRANPNIKEVEMTQYGEPYEGEKKRGEQTARAKAGKGLDPVGREDKDIDNDGDHDKTDKYLLNRRKKIGAAIATRTEEFLGEVKKNKSENKKIDVMKGSNTIVTMPPENKGNLMAHNEVDGDVIMEKAVSTAQQKFMGMVYAAKKGEKPASPEVAKAAEGMSKKEAKKFAQTKHEGLPTHKEENECGSEDEKSKMKKTEGETDSREIPTKVNLMKNKLRSMGLKMSYEPEGEDIHEVPLVVAAPLVAGGVALAAKGLGHLMNKAVEAGQKNPNRRLVTGGTVGDLNKARGISNSYQPEGEVIDEAGSARYLQSKALRSGSATLSTPIETGASLRSKVQALKSKDTTPAPAPRPATSTATPTPRPISGAEALKKRMKLGGASSPYLNQSYDPEGNVVSDGYDSRYGRGEMGEPKGTQRMKVDPEAWKRSMEQWKKLQPEIFDRPGTKLPQAKVNKNTQNKTA